MPNGAVGDVDGSDDEGNDDGSGVTVVMTGRDGVVFTAPVDTGSVGVADGLVKTVDSPGNIEDGGSVVTSSLFGGTFSNGTGIEGETVEDEYADDGGSTLVLSVAGGYGVGVVVIGTTGGCGVVLTVSIGTEFVAIAGGYEMTVNSAGNTEDG